MAKRNQNSFLKRQKEIKRQQKAQEKMMRRHGLKKDEPSEDLIEETSAATEEQTAGEQESAGPDESAESTEPTEHNEPA